MIALFHLQHHLWTSVDIWLGIVILLHIPSNCGAEIVQHGFAKYLWTFKCLDAYTGMLLTDFRSEECSSSAQVKDSSIEGSLISWRMLSPLRSVGDYVSFGI